MDQAVLNGDLKQVQELIRNGEDVNGPYGDGSLLHLAIQKGHVNIALALLAAGADVHAKDARGRTALYWACLEEIEEVVQALIDKGSGVNKRDVLDMTPLMAQRRVTDMSLCLLQAGASCKGLEQGRVDELLHYAWNKRDLLAIRCLFKGSGRVSILSTDEQEGLLHLACSEGDVFVVRTLLKNGCCVSILSTDEQEGLLHLACREGDVFVGRTLLNNGCSFSILSREEQEKLFLFACYERDVFLACTLLKNGCRVSILSGEEQEKLFHHASREGNVFVVRTLLQNGCSVKKLTQEDLLYCVGVLSKQEIEELFHLAYRQGDVFVVHTLLENGCHVSILSREEQEELFHFACHERDVYVVHTLLENGYRVSTLSADEQEGLLHHACSECDVFVVHTLLENGCSVKQLTREDLLYCVRILSKQEIEELLHHACREGNVFVVRTLLENGCHFSILSREEQEKLFVLACRESDVFVVHTLLKNGFRVSILSGEEQEQLFHLACREGDVFVTRTLLENGCRVSILSADEQEGLLHHACSESDVFVARTLLENGCCVSILSREEQEELLHLACRDEDVFVVYILLKNDFRVSILSRDEQEELFHLACREGNVFVVHTLLDKGCCVSILSREEQEKLFVLACREGDVFVVHTLLKNGFRVIILSGEEQEQLFHLACREGDVFVTRTLLENGCRVSILSADEQEGLLHHACSESDVFVARTLLENGCCVSILSRDEQEGLLHLACRDEDVFVVYILLKNDFRVSILSRDEQEELFHLACREGNVFVVHTLLDKGCCVSILSRKEQEGLLHHACRECDVFVVYILLKNGCHVSILSRDEQEKLFHLACRECDVFVVRTLLKNGCRVSILSADEQEGLLHLACRDGDVFVVRTLLKNGCRVSILSADEQEGLLHHACREGDVFVVRTLLKNGCRVSILSREEGEWLLRLACREGDAFVVGTLLTSSCDMNCVDSGGLTPLMYATVEDHEEVVKKLILAGANLGIQSANSDTALHLAAKHNSIQCGILLAEGGASVKNKNNLAKTPLHLASAEFKKAIKEARSFTTRKALCIIGNAESGKSTLIAALQAESNSSIGKIINRFRRVSDRRQRTAGIETVSHCSQRYGEVLFFDFAGQDDYHGPHQMFLESLLSKPGVSMTLLLVVKMTEQEDAILHQLHRWLTPVAQMATPASPPQVIVIGSFLDKVRSKEEATAKLTRCKEATGKDLVDLKLSLKIVGTSFLNCRQPQSEGIDQICKYLQEMPSPEFSATHTRYSLAWVLSQIRSSFTAQAVQLKEFSKWVQNNKDNLPQTMPPPDEVCQDLSAAGHALYLPNREDPPKSWLVLDLPSILHNVYGTLFSQKAVNEFGLLQCRHLTALFPDLDLEMVQQLLINLEFCLPVDPSVLKVELSKLTQTKEATGWLFFPALISAKPPQTTVEDLPQQSGCYFCWQLRTTKKHSISARLLQTILLRLAAHFVVKQPNEEGVQQHCCSIWWNGIEWQSTKGIDITVHIIGNRVIQVMGSSVASANTSCQYLTDVIGDILSTVHRLSPKLAAAAYIVHSQKIAMSPEDIIALPEKELFPVEGIRNSIRDGYCLSLKDSNTNRSTRAVISDLFGGCTPSLQDIGRINWPQPDPSQPQSPCGTSQSDALSQTVYSEYIYIRIMYYIS